MALLGYKKQFAQAVESGIKRQTIRAKRKYPIKLGENLYHYTGLRTKNCRKLLESKCLGVADIRIHVDGIFVSDQKLKEVNAKELAKQDGFSDTESFIEFFRINHGFPFHGDLIRW